MHPSTLRVLSVLALAFGLAQTGAAETPASDAADWRQAPTGISRGSYSRVSGPSRSTEPGVEAAAPAAAAESGDAAPPAAADPDAAAAEDGETDEPEEEAEPRGATYGKACVLGADGSVLYAPPGKDCGGRGATPHTPRSPARASGEGHCIYAADGSVIHRPSGASCR